MNPSTQERSGRKEKDLVIMLVDIMYCFDAVIKGRK